MMKLELLPYFYAFSMWIIIIYVYIILAKLFKIKIKNFIILSFALLIILLIFNILLQQESKNQTQIRFYFLLENIEQYKSLYGEFPNDLSHLQDVNNDYYSWCSKDSSRKIPGRGLCYYHIKNGEFTLEVIGSYNDWYYSSGTKQILENHFDRQGL
ncbi:hypothetical protein [Moraxella porci]|uniref:hypothetical protein n=1 Tax=Moraxella porci TaxID=1288392 RepID=UPI002448595C|nr:hypothetical protein [Moraxella porci]MDH2274553.1 hypothetical protein [Moraxella porci]